MVVGDGDGEGGDGGDGDGDDSDDDDSDDDDGGDDDVVDDVGTSRLYLHTRGALYANSRYGDTID